MNKFELCFKILELNTALSVVKVSLKNARRHNGPVSSFKFGTELSSLWIRAIKLETKMKQLLVNLG